MSVLFVTIIISLSSLPIFAQVGYPTSTPSMPIVIQKSPNPSPSPTPQDILPKAPEAKKVERGPHGGILQKSKSGKEVFELLLTQRNTFRLYMTDAEGKEHRPNLNLQISRIHLTYHPTVSAEEYSGQSLVLEKHYNFYRSNFKLPTHATRYDVTIEFFQNNQEDSVTISVDLTQEKVQ